MYFNTVNVNFLVSNLNIPCKSQMRTRETITQDASRARWKNDYTRLA